jgi:hypothetical protein
MFMLHVSAICTWQNLELVSDISVVLASLSVGTTAFTRDDETKTPIVSNDHIES